MVSTYVCVIIYVSCTIIRPSELLPVGPTFKHAWAASFFPCTRRAVTSRAADISQEHAWAAQPHASLSPVMGQTKKDTQVETAVRATGMQQGVAMQAAQPGKMSPSQSSSRKVSRMLPKTDGKLMHPMQFTSNSIRVYGLSCNLSATTLLPFEHFAQVFRSLGWWLLHPQMRSSQLLPTKDSAPRWKWPWLLEVGRQPRLNYHKLNATKAAVPLVLHCWSLLHVPVERLTAK